MCCVLVSIHCLVGSMTICMLPTVGSEPPITALAISRDFKNIVAASQAGIDIYDSTGHSVERSLPVDMPNIHDMQFSRDGKRLIVCGGSPASQGTITIYRWPMMERVMLSTPHQDVVNRVVWIDELDQIATASADTTCCVLDSQTGNVLQRFTGHSRPVTALVRLRDLGMMASASVDHAIRVWNPVDGSLIRILDNHVSAVNDLAVLRGEDSTESNMLASIGEDRTVRMWHTNTGRLVRSLRLEIIPRRVLWNGGDSLWVGCNDGCVQEIRIHAWELGRVILAKNRIHELIAIDKHTMLLGGPGGLQWIQPDQAK
jgi:WD40 repeat protein